MTTDLVIARPARRGPGNSAAPERAAGHRGSRVTQRHRGLVGSPTAATGRDPVSVSETEMPGQLVLGLVVRANRGAGMSVPRRRGVAPARRAVGPTIVRVARFEAPALGPAGVSVPVDRQAVSAERMAIEGGRLRFAVPDLIVMASRVQAGGRCVRSPRGPNAGQPVRRAGGPVPKADTPANGQRGHSTPLGPEVIPIDPAVVVSAENVRTVTPHHEGIGRSGASMVAVHAEIPVPAANVQRTVSAGVVRVNLALIVRAATAGLAVAVRIDPVRVVPRTAQVVRQVATQIRSAGEIVSNPIRVDVTSDGRETAAPLDQNQRVSDALPASGRCPLSLLEPNCGSRRVGKAGRSWSPTARPSQR